MHDSPGALVAAAAAGDQRAWDSLVARFNPLLWSVARSFRLAAGEDADAVQNTWLRLVENLDRIVDPERVGAWLATTVRRECLQALRRQGRVDWSTESVDELEIADAGADLDAALLLDERDAALWRALQGLSPRCRMLLRVLMTTPPPSYAEVSAALGLPVGSIGPSRQRCLARLRATVAGDQVLDETSSLGERS